MVVEFACLIVCFPSHCKNWSWFSLGHASEVNLPVHKDTWVRIIFPLLLHDFPFAWCICVAQTGRLPVNWAVYHLTSSATAYVKRAGSSKLMSPGGSRQRWHPPGAQSCTQPGQGQEKQPAPLRAGTVWGTEGAAPRTCGQGSQAREDCESRAAPVSGANTTCPCVIIPACRPAGIQFILRCGPLSLAPAHCWFQMCFGKKAKVPMASAPTQLALLLELSFHSCRPTCKAPGWPGICIWRLQLWRGRRWPGQRAPRPLGRGPRRTGASGCGFIPSPFPLQPPFPSVYSLFTGQYLKMPEICGRYIPRLNARPIVRKES